MNTVPLSSASITVRDRVRAILTRGPLPLRDIARRLSVDGCCDLEIEHTLKGLIRDNQVTHEPVYRLVEDLERPIDPTHISAPDVSQAVRSEVDAIIQRARDSAAHMKAASRRGARDGNRSAAKYPFAELRVDEARLIPCVPEDIEKLRGRLNASAYYYRKKRPGVGFRIDVVEGGINLVRTA